MVITSAPGEEAQVDYGDGPMVRDADSGKYRRTRLFVLTLGYSRKAVRLLVHRSSAQVWAELHERAFRRLGGTAERRQGRLPFTGPARPVSLDHDAFDLVERDRVRRPVVELRRLRRRVAGDPLRVLECPAVRQIRRDARRPKRVPARRRRQSRCRRSPLDHCQHDAARQRPPAQPARSVDAQEPLDGPASTITAGSAMAGPGRAISRRSTPACWGRGGGSISESEFRTRSGWIRSALHVAGVMDRNLLAAQRMHDRSA